MARAFAAASSQYFVNANAIVAAEPLTMACWVKPNGITTNYAVMAIDTEGGTARWGLNFLGAGGGDPISALSTNTVGTSAQSDVTGGTATWQHAAGVWASTTSRTAYRNGTAGTTNTTSISVTGIDTTRIAARYAGTLGAFLDGSVAEAAIWNVALTAAEIASLAAGFCPLLVRPQSLVAYWPLFARATDEESWVGAFPMTNTNTATAAQHPPRIIYPSWPRIIIPAAAGGTTVARLVNGGLVNGGTLIGGRLARMAA